MTATTSTVLTPGTARGRRREKRRQQERRAARAQRIRERVADLVAALPVAEPQQREALAQQVSDAAIRVGESMEGVVAPFVIGVIFFPLLLAVPALWLALSHAAQWRAQGATIHVATGCGGAMVLLASSLFMVAWTKRHRWRTVEPAQHRPAPLVRRMTELAPVACALALCACLVPFCLVILNVNGSLVLPAHWWVDALDGAALATAMITILWSPLRLAQARREDNLDLPAAAGALLPMCAAVSFMARHADEWRKPKTIRFLSNRLETAAASLESAPWTRRAALFAPALRAANSVVLLKLATHIRDHIIKLNLAMSPEEYHAVLRDLTHGLIAMAADDWPRLREVVDHIDPVTFGWARWIRRHAIPALVLAAFAALLPLLPGLHDQNASVIGLRLTLGVAALLRLLPKNLSVTDLITSAMQNVTSSRRP